MPFRHISSEFISSKKYNVEICSLWNIGAQANIA